MHEFKPLSTLLLACLLIGCARATETPAPLPAVQAIATATSLPQATSLSVALVATATPGPTSSPTVTPLPTVTVTPIPVKTFRVAFVPVGQTLNVHTGPGDSYGVVGTIPPNVSGVQSGTDSEQAWLQIRWSSLDGWANRYFLTEEVDSPTFCLDPAARQVVDAFRSALERRDGGALVQLVHPRRGLLVRVNWWNNEVRLDRLALPFIFSSEVAYDWGFEDGSGLPIQGSFKEIILPILDRDFAGTPQIRCNELVSGGTAGIIQLPFEYSPVNYYAVYRPPQDNEFDWGTWALGVEYWAGKPYLSYLVHYKWEI